VYGQEVVMPMEYIVLSLRVVAITEMTDLMLWKIDYFNNYTWRKNVLLQDSPERRKAKAKGMA